MSQKCSSLKPVKEDLRSLRNMLSLQGFALALIPTVSVLAVFARGGTESVAHFICLTRRRVRS